MPNKSGSVYGLTILSPIVDDPHAGISHDLQLRMLLGTMHRDQRSPFATLSSTHLARLTVMNDVVYVGMPSCEEHLKSQYLVFESNFDGELDDYLRRMTTDIPDTVNAVWGHCQGFPGTKDVKAFSDYMKKCQITTTFYFADVNDKTVDQTLRALQAQSAVAEFIDTNQGKHGAELQRAFAGFLSALKTAPAPIPGFDHTEAEKCSVAGTGASSIHE